MADHAGIGNDDRKQVQDYMRREFSALMRVPQKTVYHYTSGEAAASILDQAKFRATNILYLDDGREMQHAVDCFREAMALRQSQQAGPGFAELDGMISRYLSEVGSRVPPDVWIVTLTERRDSSHHWNRYTQEGHGVALGFSPTGLARAAEAGGAFLAPCCYDDATNVSIMERGLALLEKLYAERRKRSGAAEAGEQLVRYVLRELALFGALMKRSERAEGDEWRLILCNASQTAVGARRINAIAKPLYTSLYIELEIGDVSNRLPAGEIVIGPSPYQQMTERAFRTLLYKHGYEGADVTLSRTPQLALAAER